MGCCGSLWDVVAYCGMWWFIVRYGSSQWNLVASGMGCGRSLWGVLVYLWWFIVGCGYSLWDLWWFIGIVLGSKCLAPGLMWHLSNLLRSVAS
jgi:hypothetical protein